MTKQFWVNNYFIDVTRNQIQHQQQATALPPKALRVLAVLASRAGEVVTHDELMEIVWEKSVVGPNTLQRAIAQLRKAFGDDSKQQAFIKTHAKQGYSLEAKVRWESEPVKEPSSITPAHQTQTKNPYFYSISASVLVSVLVFIFWPTSSPFYTSITPLTASDEQEFNAAYSPDGNFLVFNRYMGQCESHLWAKDLRNNQEERLSTEPGHYSELSWSADGSQLAFILESTCSDKPQEIKQCWQLQTIDFAAAWNGSTEHLSRYDCKDQRTSHPTWLNDGRIAFLQYPLAQAGSPNNRPTIKLYDAVADELTAVLHDTDGRIYSLTYSRTTNLLATVSVTEKNQHILRTLTPEGELQTQTAIKYQEQHSVYDRFPVSFSPNGKEFISSVNGKIFQLNSKGVMRAIHPEHFSGMWSPVYHPNGNKIAATYGTKDFDIGRLHIQDAKAELKVMARSTASDANAQFQPNGTLIAFFSRRSGTNQIWLIDGQRTYQLTHFKQGIKSARFSWSPDGQTLVVNVNHQMAIVSLDGSHVFLNTKGIDNQPHIRLAVSTLMPWTQPEKLLVTDNQADNHQLFSVDIESGEIHDTGLENVLWASYTKAGNIIYVDQQTDVWMQSPQGTQALTELNKKVFGNYILNKNDTLYAINADAQLWRYNIQTGTLKILARVDKDVNYVSDIHDNHILATQFIGGRRELVELGL